MTVSKKARTAAQREAVQSCILRCLKRYGSFTTEQLVLRLGLSRKSIAHNAQSLCRQGRVSREVEARYHDLIEYRWSYRCDESDDLSTLSKVGVTAADDDWQAFWRTPKTERRYLPKPADYIPIDPQVNTEIWRIPAP